MPLTALTQQNLVTSAPCPSEGFAQLDGDRDGVGDGGRHTRDQGVFSTRQNCVLEKNARGQSDPPPPWPPSSTADDGELPGTNGGVFLSCGKSQRNGQKEREVLLKQIEDEIDIDESFYFFGGGPLVGAANRLEQLAAESQVDVFWARRSLEPGHRKQKRAAQEGLRAEERRKFLFSSFAVRLFLLLLAVSTLWTASRVARISR